MRGDIGDIAIIGRSSLLIIGNAMVQARVTSIRMRTVTLELLAGGLCEFRHIGVSGCGGVDDVGVQWARGY